MKILWTLSSVGLGHLIRDIAIVEKMQEISDAKVDFLMPGPITDEVSGKYHVLYESNLLKGSGNAYYKVFEKCKDKFDLISFIREDSKYYKHDFEITISVLDKNGYSALVGDEAFWLLSGFGRRWAKKEVPFIYITDFIGMRAMDGSIFKKTYIWNKNLQFTMSGNVPDLSIFVGSPEEIPDKAFGFLLPNQRKWAKEYYHFVKPILKMDTSISKDKNTLRKLLNLPISKQIYISVISKVGNYSKLLSLIENTFKIIKNKESNSYFIIVGSEKGSVDFINYFSYLDDLVKYFAASDFAITQTGYGKIIELSALSIPFISIPLDYHFEQEYIMEYRLNHYGIGQQVLLRETTPEKLFDTIKVCISKKTKPLKVDNGSEVANLIIDFLYKR